MTLLTLRRRFQSDPKVFALEIRARINEYSGYAESYIRFLC